MSQLDQSGQKVSTLFHVLQRLLQAGAQKRTVGVATVTKGKKGWFQGWFSYCSDGCRSDSRPGGTEGARSLRDRSGHRAGLHRGGCAQWLPRGGRTSS